MFTPGKRYNRRQDLHEVYGGQRQGGISTPKEHPLIFLFTGDQGEQYGYEDGFQEDGTFWYTGEGQVGDMQMLRGNRSIRDHATDGKSMHLFQYVGTGTVEYVGEFVSVGDHEHLSPDRNGNLRKVFVFELALDSGGTSGVVPKSLARSEPREASGLWTMPLSELRTNALTTAGSTATRTERKYNVYKRSESVRVYVLRRAEGDCEGCGTVAPFTRKRNGQPYLEPHHILRLADAGPDHPRWVIALCPNCHRRVHYGAEGDEYNEMLAQKVGQIEGP